MNVIDLPERMAHRIVVTEAGCWEWQGSRGHKGHGMVWFSGRMRPVHRVVFELLTGLSTASAEDMDHLCRNPPCCRPDHVEPVTHAENMRRGIQSFAARQTCLSGRHDITLPGSVSVIGTARKRRCRECLNEYRRTRRAQGLRDSA